MHVAPDVISPVGLFGIGREVKIGEQQVPRLEQRDLRLACGSLTFTIMSLSRNTAGASGRIVAPTAR